MSSMRPISVKVSCLYFCLFLLPVFPLESGERDGCLPASAAQFIQAAVAGHLQQPALQRHIRQQDRQGKVELEVHLLEHIRDLIAILEKAPNVTREQAVVST